MSIENVKIVESIVISKDDPRYDELIKEVEALCDCGKPFGEAIRWNVPTQGILCAACFNKQVASRSTRQCC